MSASIRGRAPTGGAGPRADAIELGHWQHRYDSITRIPGVRSIDDGVGDRPNPAFFGDDFDFRLLYQPIAREPIAS